jgi:hypothetical protein
LQTALEDANRRAAEAETYAQQLAAKQQVDANLMRISQKTGLPLSEAQRLFYEERKSADDIWDVAADYYADQRRKRKAVDDDDDDDARADKARRNRVDSGEAKGRTTPADELRTRLDTHRANKDAPAFILEKLKARRNS